MLHYLFIFVFFSFSSNCWAGFTLNGSVTLQGTNFSAQNIYLLQQTGSSETTAHQIYVPYRQASDSKKVADANHYFGSLPVVDNNMNITITGINHTAPNNRILYLAFRPSNSNTYQVVGIGSTNGATATLSIQALLNTRNFTYTDTSTGFTLYLYVFYYASGLNLNDNIDVSKTDFKDGIYFQTLFSTLLSNSTVSNVPKINFIVPGDQSLDVNFDTTALYTTFTTNPLGYVSLVYDNTKNPHPDQGTGNFTTFAVANTFKPVVTFSSVSVPGSLHISQLGDKSQLKNSTDYNVAVAVVDRYNFVSYVSNVMKGTPMEIEMFLREKGCFLLSAGFRKDHYVLEYFRHFRDEILLKNDFGSLFVQNYYRIAPPYAQIIYHNSFLSFCFKGLGYLLYFLFHFYPLWSTLLLLRIAWRIQKRKSIHV